MYISILVIILLLLLPIVHTFFKPAPIFTKIRLEREAALFFHHTAVEVNQAQRYDIDMKENTLDLYIGATISEYKKLDNHKVRRGRKDLAYQGHIEMAHFVKDVRFSEVNERVFHVSLILQENNIEFETERWMGLKVNERLADPEEPEEELRDPEGTEATDETERENRYAEN